MKARDKPRNCTECGKYHTCTNTYYGWIGCEPEKKAWIQRLFERVKMLFDRRY